MLGSQGEILPFKDVFDQELKGKTVVVRVDLNSSIVEGRVVVSSRLREHAKTIYALCEEGAKVVVLSHQGRKGEADFIPLKRHADFIKKFVDRNVKFVKWDENFVKAIKEMREGTVVVLDNTRFLDIEEAKGKTAKDFVAVEPFKSLAGVADYFVQDALSVCHRNHASVVALAARLPSFVGPVLKRELEGLKKLEEIKDGKLLVLGGAKVSDSIEIVESMLEKKLCNEVCIGGLFGEVFLKAKGVNFGKSDALFETEEMKKLLPKAAALLKKHGSRIVLPVDVASKPNGGRRELKLKDLPVEEAILDIGVGTTELFKKKVRASKLVVFNGPLGVYEQKSFEIGTKKLLETIAFSRCFSLVGGGDTERALFQIGLLPQDFTHVSIAGKALLEYLAGKKLPGLAALENGV
ncbi:MAG: 3-phosphoglycerate kinase, phosphoglycerate kinase [archaeon GW2011_AR10]|nr:MAG: 3-phosphoglycerate kinase, phosphoglycerate kinase [archaeon GW2011_AR10]